MSKLLLASVTAIGLLLAGPQKVSAQTVFACVSSAANSPIIIEPTANAPCPPSAGGQTWTKTTLSTTPGALGARQFSCVSGSNLTNDGALAGSAGTYGTGVQFGSGIDYTPGGLTFLLNSGIYLVQLSVPAVSMMFPPLQSGFASITVTMLEDGTGVDTFIGSSAIVPSTIPGINSMASVPVNGSVLLQITVPNTVFFFGVQFSVLATSTFLPFGCKITFTRLQ